MKIEFSAADLRPIADVAVEAALDRIRAEDRDLDAGRIAFVEAEAAQSMGLPPHILRDARLRGEITGSRIGKRICYTRTDLLEFLRRTREKR
jgi:hypothetical protein